MKDLNRTVALLCALILFLAVAPATLANEAGLEKGNSELGISLDVWTFLDLLVNHVVEVLAGDSENPADSPGGDEPQLLEEDDDGSPKEEAFPWVDPAG